MTRLRRLEWRRRAWIVYLATGALLTGGVPVVPAAKGEWPADQPARALLVDRDRGRDLSAPPEGPRRLAALHRRPVPLLRRRPLHLQLSEAHGSRGRVPVVRRCHLPDRLPGTRRRAARSGETAQSAGRPRGRDRLADPHGRNQPAFVGLPRRPEHPHLGTHVAREDCLGRLPARRHSASRRCRSSCCRHGQACARLLPPRREHRLAARGRLRLHARAAHRYLQPPAHLRRWLDRLLPPLGGGGTSPLHAHARGACAGLAHAAYSRPSRSARRSLLDRARCPLLPGDRRPGRARADRGLGALVPARRHAHGRPGSSGGTRDCP